MPKKFKFMFYCVEGTGHLNACIGFAQILTERGHETVFAINESWEPIVKKFGFRVLPLKQETVESDFKLSENPAKDFARMFQDVGLLTNKN